MHGRVDPESGGVYLRVCVCVCLRHASFVICDHFGFRAAIVHCLIITLIYLQLVYKELCKSHQHTVPAPQMRNHVDPNDLISWLGTQALKLASINGQGLL